MELTQDVVSIVNRANVPEDAKQEFYLKWLESEDKTFPTVGQLRAYIFNTLKHTSGNLRFTEINRRRIEQENHEAIISGLGLDESPDNPAEEVEMQDAILTKLDSLSAVLRETLVQYYVEGRAPEDIAEANGENVEAVRKRITRARNQLKGEV